eukprot:379159-Prorocentrum_minimum.AAC.1
MPSGRPALARFLEQHVVPARSFLLLGILLLGLDPDVMLSLRSIAKSPASVAAREHAAPQYLLRGLPAQAAPTFCVRTSLAFVR